MTIVMQVEEQLHAPAQYYGLCMEAYFGRRYFECREELRSCKKKEAIHGKTRSSQVSMNDLRL